MIATFVIIVITLFNIIVYKLRQFVEAKICEKLSIPSSLPSEQLCRRFSLAEILSATKDWDESLVIGQGGFGKVYKGVIDNGATTVAIKRLNTMSKQGAPQFWTEIAMLSKIRHSHIIYLIGYCNNWDEMILVYRYMIYGTLADHLYKIGKNGGNNSTLSWVQRLKICIGAAHGLNHLHTGMGVKDRVIHRDVKSSNILLDENWAAKISDFGLSKVGPANQSFTHVSTNVKGTVGYLDLEYFLTRRLTKKSDVYAFGVVLFEVLCGRPAVDLRLDVEQRGLAGWAQQCIKEGKLYQIIDPNLIGQILPDSLTAFEQIADQCLHKFSKKRPTMAEVVVSLERSLALQERIDSSMLEWEFFNTVGAYDNQENAVTSMEQQEVINAGNDLHEELIDGIRRLGDASSGQKQIDGNAYYSREQLKVISAGTSVEQMEGILQLQDAKSSHSHVNFAKTMAFTRKLRLFFFGRARGTSAPGHTLVKAADSTCLAGGASPCLNGITVDKSLEFSYEELAKATDDFSIAYKIGQGGFGAVYYAELRGEKAAIKKMDVQASKEFLSELKVLMHVQHLNLVHLIGYCVEGSLFLVYGYIDNGNLRSYLRGSEREPLPWSTRVQIALDSARGLEYIHEHTAPAYIHRDIKSENILIDKNFHGKVADFGLSKLVEVECTSLPTRLVGTFGYMPPEYAQYGDVSPKVDVYAFGVVLYELISAKEPLVKENASVESKGLVALFEEVLHQPYPREDLGKLVDPRLGYDYPFDSVRKMALLAKACTHENPYLRPCMRSIVVALMGLSSSPDDWDSEPILNIGELGGRL